MRLTSKQHQVARLAAEGLKPREIAQRMNIKASTVSSHLQSAILALGVSGRHEIKAALDMAGCDPQLSRLCTGSLVPALPSKAVREFLLQQCFADDEIDGFYQQFVAVAAVATVVTK